MGGALSATEIKIRLLTPPLHLPMCTSLCSPLLYTWQCALTPPLYFPSSLVDPDNCRVLQLLSLHRQFSIRISLPVSPESRLVLIQMYFFLFTLQYHHIHLKHAILQGMIKCRSAVATLRAEQGPGEPSKGCKQIRRAIGSQREPE